jgi:hypothetical protein
MSNLFLSRLIPILSGFGLCPLFLRGWKTFRIEFRAFGFVGRILIIRGSHHRCIFLREFRQLRATRRWFHIYNSRKHVCTPSRTSPWPIGYTKVIHKWVYASLVSHRARWPQKYRKMAILRCPSRRRVLGRLSRRRHDRFPQVGFDSQDGEKK